MSRSLNTREAPIEAQAVRILEEQYHIVGLKLNVHGRIGWPDRCFFIPGGKPVLVEFKRPGESVGPKQAHVHRYLQALGYAIQTFDDVTAAVAFVVHATKCALTAMGAADDR